jgi:hypothetical protein
METITLASVVIFMVGVGIGMLLQQWCDRKEAEKW